MIAIVGATGYIGRYLCPYLLKKSCDILALGRSNNAQKFFEGFDLVVFALSPEPAWTDGDIGLRGMPDSSVHIARVECVNGRGACSGGEALGVQWTPVGSSRYPALVSDPTATGTSVAEHDSSRLQFQDGLMEARPIIDLPLPVRTLTVSSVEPLLEDFSIPSIMDAFQCLDIDVVIFRSAIMGVVAVPRGDIDSELEAFLGASL